MEVPSGVIPMFSKPGDSKILASARMLNYDTGHGYIDADLIEDCDFQLNNFLRMKMSELPDLTFEIPFDLFASAVDHAIVTPITEGETSYYPSWNFEEPACILIGKTDVNQIKDREDGRALIGITLKKLDPVGKSHQVLVREFHIKETIEILRKGLTQAKQQV